MTDEHNNTPPAPTPDEAPSVLEHPAFQIGVTNTIQGMLAGIQHLAGEDMVLAGFVMYVRSGAPNNKAARAHWNRVAVRLRDLYFNLDKLEQESTPQEGG